VTTNQPNQSNEPNEPDDLERRLRQGMQQEAGRITPNDRRTEILGMVNDKTQSVDTARRWLAPVAAAASVVLIGGVIWGVSSNDSSQQAAAPAVTQSATAPPTSGTVPVGPVKSPSAAKVHVPAPNVPPPAPGGSLIGVTSQLALPAYFVGPVSPGAKSFGLYREFVRTAVPASPTSAQKVKAAVAVAMRSQPFTSVEHYLLPWSGTSVSAVTVTTSRITITLSGPGANGFTAAQTKLAVQQLVWTAQAAVGKGAIPVKLGISTGATKLFGRYSTALTYNRPPASTQYQVLAPIWITSPVRSQVFAAGTTVVAAGQSCAFEATTQWQLKKSGANVKSGFTTASSGCPTRGTWQVRLGVLAPGSYTFRMYEVSQEDGVRVIAETSKPFTVR
jgi:hypothetical protein